MAVLRLILLTMIVIVVSALDASEPVHHSKGSDAKLVYEKIASIRYLQDDRPERMDAYIPKVGSGKPYPAVVYIHGGGWTKGTRDNKRAVNIASTLAGAGIAVFSIDYKLALREKREGGNVTVEGSWPQNIFDCKTAVRYVRKNAGGYGIDPNNIGVMGCSAGGHLALLTGLSSESEELNNGGLYCDVSNDIKCIVDMYGIPDVRVWGGHVFIEPSQNDAPEMYRLASPVTYIEKDSPAVLVIHGDKDKVVNVEQSRLFVDKLKEIGASYKYVEVKEGPHSFDLENHMDIRPVVIDFLKEQLM
ncbi:MAG: alpha/beta hydrolase fold domain-containing protein [Sedimentisphaeraceae bacterium JB056]